MPAYKRDSDGKWHEYYDQSKGSSCGPACVRTVLKMATGKEWGEDYIRQQIETDEGALQVSSISSEHGGMAQAGSHNWGAHGAAGGGGGGMGTWNIDEVLRTHGIPEAHFSNDYPRNSFRKTDLLHPAIAAVGWNGGWNAKGATGLHWIVIAGQLRNGSYLVIDPAYGLGEISIDTAKLEYVPNGGGGVRATFVNDRVCLTQR